MATTTKNTKHETTATRAALADTTAIVIPALDQWCGSWIVSRKVTGEAIGEFFDKKIVARFNPATCNIETAAEYLGRINQAIAAANIRKAGGNRRRWK